jgi:phosphatidylglycerophosphate synthase
VLVLLVVGFARSPGLFTLVLMLVGLLVVAVWSLRAAVLRLHDMDMSAWWSILLFVPYLGMAASLLLMVLPGTHGDNDYGEPARRGNWLLAFVSLALLCLTLGLAWRTVSLAFRGDLPGLAGIEAPAGDAEDGSADSSSVPDMAMRNIPPGEAAEEFHQNYWPASTHKAFAVSSAGAWGWKAGAASVEQAARDALSACESRREPYTPSCVLVNLNGYSGQPGR